MLIRLYVFIEKAASDDNHKEDNLYIKYHNWLDDEVSNNVNGDDHENERKLKYFLINN